MDDKNKFSFFKNAFMAGLGFYVAQMFMSFLGTVLLLLAIAIALLLFRFFS